MPQDRCFISLRPGLRSPNFPLHFSGGGVGFAAGRLSGMEKEHKPKLLSPDIFRWGRGLPREGVGAKKFDMCLETREIKPLGEISRDFGGMSQNCPKSLRKKFVFDFGP